MARDIDAELLSEIYELAVSLSPQALTATTVFPHLQLWKIHHAITLAENGNKAAAQKYCDAITAAVKAWNKPSPYFNQSFGHVLEDLTKRLQEAPRDASSGVNGSKWIPKLTSDAVSSSMWGAFNKFVSGGEEDGQDGPGGHQIADGEGPFGKITPSVSRVQSSADLYGSYGPGSQLYTPAPPSGGSSPSAARIAPAGRYAPSPATARSSLEGQRPNAYDTNRRMSSESYRSTPTNGNSYEPINQSYEPPAPAGNPYEPSPAQYGTASAYAPKASLQAHQEVSEKTLSPAPAPAYSPYSNGYQPDQGGTGGYEPPSSSGGYAPPNDEFVPYQPEEDDDDETIAATPKPKKSMLDDDDDTSELLKKSEAVKKSAAAGEEKRKAEEKKKGTSCPLTTRP